MMCRICGCPDKRWLRVSTVARQFECAPKTVRRLIRCGRIDGVQFGREWRIDHQSLDAFVRKDSVRFSVPSGGRRR